MSSLTIGQLTVPSNANISDRYDPNLLPLLEQHVDAQIQNSNNTSNTDFYDLEANLATLKIYQFFPEKTNTTVVKKILSKALMNLQNGFSLYLFLIPERIQQQEEIAKIIALSTLLEACQFKKFWTEYDSNKALFQEVVGFENGVREFIIGVLTITHTKLDKSFVSEVLRCDNSQLDKITNEKGWTSDDKFISFPVNDYNQPKSKGQNKKQLRFSEVAKVLQI